MWKRGGGRGTGRRRTVLQLSAKREPTFGFGYRPSPQEEVVEQAPAVPPFNALGGLMSNYGEDSEEEEEQPQLPPQPPQPVHPRPKDYKHQKMKFVSAKSQDDTPTPPREMSPAPPSSLQPPSDQMQINGNAKNGSKDEIDAKVFDFLAEISAIDGEGESEEKKEKGDEDQQISVAAPDKAVPGKTLDDSSDEEELVEPEAPSTVWQHCLDEGTQCYYYWNYETNEVTWEIPTGYSQYLLLNKEYEERLLKYQAKLETRKNRPRKCQIKSDTEVKAAPLNKPQEAQTPKGSSSGLSSLVPYDETPEPIKKQQTKEVSPTLPPNYSNFVVPESSEEEAFEVVEAPYAAQIVDEKQVNWPTSEGGATRDEDSLDGVEMEDTDSSEVPVKVAAQSQVIPTGPTEENNTENDVENDLDVDDFDFDDIDQQLDLALERKTKAKEINKLEDSPIADRPTVEDIHEESVTVQLANGEEVTKQIKSEFTAEGAEKRSAPTDPDLDNCMEPSTKKKKYSAPSIKTEVKEVDAKLETITDLSSVLTDKLEFLDISRKGLSKLQILLIEIQTRLADWREGGLSTEHMLKKLREANLCLEQYESSAAPPGWSCHFDRTYRRYFYCNHVTSDTQWDYPDGDQVTPDEQSQAAPAPADQARPAPPPPPADHLSLPREHDTPPAQELPAVNNTSSEDQTINSEAVISEEGSSAYSNLLDRHSLTDTFKMCMNPPPPPDEPPPPGTEPPLPPLEVGFSSLAALAAAPPPPPPPPEEEPTPMVAPMEQVEMVHPGDLYQPYEAETYDTPETTTHSMQENIHIIAPPVITRAAQPVAPDGALMEEAGAVCYGQPTLNVGANQSSESITEEDKVELPTQQQLTTSSKKKKKDKDKEKTLVGGGLTLKRKKVPSLVQKWQKVQKEVEEEASKDAMDDE